MSQDGQTHFKNLAGNAARLLKCVWPFWDIMHIKGSSLTLPLVAKSTSNFFGVPDGHFNPCNAFRVADASTSDDN